MINFITKLEKYFNDKWQNVFKHAEDLKLSPFDMIEIAYLYYLEKDEETDRDAIMFKMSDFSMVEMVEFIQNIKNQILKGMS